jgi:hypothetical protein
MPKVTRAATKEKAPDRLRRRAPPCYLTVHRVHQRRERNLIRAHLSQGKGASMPDPTEIAAWLSCVWLTVRIVREVKEALRRS